MEPQKVFIKISQNLFDSDDKVQRVEAHGELTVTFPDKWDEGQCITWLFHLERNINQEGTYRAHIAEAHANSN